MPGPGPSWDGEQGQLGPTEPTLSGGQAGFLPSTESPVTRMAQMVPVLLLLLPPPRPSTSLLTQEQTTSAGSRPTGNQVYCNWGLAACQQGPLGITAKAQRERGHKGAWDQPCTPSFSGRWPRQ